MAAGVADGGSLMLNERAPLISGMPTPQDFYRFPRELGSRFFQWLDAWSQNFPFLINPHALERHHRLVKELADYFRDCGMEVEDYIRVLRAADHRLNPDGLRTGKGRGGNWNAEWREFMEVNPAQNTAKQQGKIMQKLEEMERKYGVDNKGYLLPPKRKPK